MADAAISAAEPKKRRSARRNVYLTTGSSLLALFVVLAVFGGAVAPYDPNAQDLMAILDPPSASHWFGADQVGRDILSRIIVGTRATLSIALTSVAVAGVIGVALGVVSGYFGGFIDRAITVVMDLLLTVPNMVLAIAVVSVVGASAAGLTVAITVSFVPPLARLVRGRVMELRDEDFISAARTLGIRQPRILVRHVLPNAVSVIVIELSLLAGQAVLVASALGFLGLGVQPPDPEWGSMLGTAREYLTTAPHLVIAPGLAITLLVFAFNMLGDGLRDRFDPNTSP
ncbi:ABC transporter permease [Microvirga antarctica]|uniref:ABC transporter permease n=1 Tax=Microvirga antarctica TaxID=2819233 RepID=UPI001B312793|nr:ABC transporter permease [Microvirga antarctica]